MGPSKNPSTDIIRKGSVITMITLVSRPLGYVREAYQAYLFGATFLVDAFVVAFNFPELIQTLFFSGATSAFLVPVCSRYLSDDKEYQKIYSTFINLSILVTLVLSLFFLIFSGGITRLIAPGFTQEGQSVAKTLFVIMIPVILLHTILSVMKAFLNAKEHFAAPELSGILWNLVFIGAAALLSKKFGIYCLAIGVTAGSLLQVLLQIPYLRKLNIRYSFSLSLSHPSVLTAKKLFAGALIGTSIVPINSFVGRIIGSYLPHGEVASLAYAFRIFVLPFSLFAVPVYTVMFSKISRLFHEHDMREIFSHIDSTTALLSVALVPSTVVLCTTGDWIIQLLYQRGAFSYQDTLMTNRALFGYGVGLVFYGLSLSFVRIFNALHDMKTPAVIGITSIALNALLASLLMARMRNMGISLATSIVSFYNFAMLYYLLKKKTGYRMSRKAIREVILSLVAGVIIAIFVYALRFLFPGNIFISLSLVFTFTAFIYFLFFRDYLMVFLKKRK